VKSYYDDEIMVELTLRWVAHKGRKKEGDEEEGKGGNNRIAINR
jgi:hypothetical protein